MSNLTKNVLYYGKDEPLPERIPLRAGPLSAIYENGDLRYVRLGAREILRRVYSATRDHNWGTVPPKLSNIQMDIRPDSFRITYDVENRQRDIDFFWAGAITGEADGTITFTMHGEARSTFRRNRLGFCVLHPMHLAGHPCTVEHVDGSITEGAFPLTISPHQPFLNIRAITHEVIPGVRAEVRMEGDTFEMEDQRNWTDASYKTYCTPLAIPYPVTVEKGTQIAQSVTVRLIGDAPRTREAERGSLTFHIEEQAFPLPRIGLGVASHGRPLAAREIERLRALNLAHLRVDVRLAQADVEATLRRAAEEAKALGAALEVAVHVTDNAEAELSAFRALLNEVKPPVCTWLIFHARELSTTEPWVRLARQILGDYAPEARLGAGTNAFFTELNRERPPVRALDLVAYSVNPEVHAFDNASIVETLETLAVTLASARGFCGDAALAVSPVTFKMRWNPAATGPEPEPGPGEVPAQVEPRQMSLFGAGWTAGSVKYLAAGGAYSVTYFETTGWLGVMETAEGSPVPDRFRSIPGGVFPMYHVFADVGGFAGGEVLASQSSDPLTVDGVALRKGGKTRVILANYTAAPQPVTVRGVRGALTVRSLDETNAESAMRDPERFRAGAGASASAGAEGLALELKPFAVVRIDSVG